MSKTVRTKRVTSVTKVVDVYGNRLVRGSDGGVWHVGSYASALGSLLTNGSASCAIRPEGVRALKQLQAATAKFAAARKAFEDERKKVKVGNQGAYGPLIIGEDGSVSVGCTRVNASDVPGFIKALGL